jgi:monofunctional biosynthetic peptidoglycan transglycosylase
MVARHRGLIRRILRRAARFAAVVLLAVAGVVLLLRWVNPPVTWLMLTEWRRLGSMEREWVAIGAMSPYLPLSAVAAEDANFCRHLGFDLDGIRAAIADDTRLRGGSTISQQVAKNVFLWPARSWLRKGLETGFTLLIEALWPKRRILEVYLNVAEFDAGVFGVEAASRRYFGVGAADVGPQRASRLMAILPDPKRRSPVSGTAYIRKRGAAIQRGAATVREDGRAGCFL